MTRRRFPLFLLPAVLFVLAAVPSTVHGNDGDDSFGSNFAGSWLGQGSFGLDFDCDGVADTPPGPAFTDAHTFGVGGIHLATNPANPNTGNGTWEKTGARQIAIRDVTFLNVLTLVNDIDGMPVQVPTTNLNLIAVISVVVDFDKGYESATSSFGARLYSTAQDPLDPSEAPIICTAGGHDSLRKVSATE